MMKFNNNQVLSPGINFNDLSLKDLLDARDLFHVHLLNKRNVVATAVGRYRIRKGDPQLNDPNYAQVTKKPNRDARTLHNSEVRSYSWPCILVFVKEWMKDEELSKYENLNEIIPKNIYLPDGRIVPICVVVATKDDHVEEYTDPSQIIFPTNLIGGGFPLIVESQGVQRIASIGCIVTDHNKYYALTNKHVVGDPGTVIYTRLKGVLTPIGKSSSKTLGNIIFSQVYLGWDAKNLFINTDIGLIEIDDITMWKTDVFGLGTYGKLADLNTFNFSLNLVGAQVVAFGSVSGKLQGEIAALFYRYKSVGGYEYAADFLIGPRASGEEDKLLTRHGDSGTLWLLETQSEDTRQTVLMPIALQWGQHTFSEDGSRSRSAYALATCLSNVLRMLEVDLVRDWNLDNDYTWGKLGHFSIATLACSMVKNNNLKQLMTNNTEVITFGFDDLTISKIDSGLKLLKDEQNFVPLADVPDLVWKSRVTGIKRGSESPNHFADMDKPDSTGETLLDKCTGSFKNMKFLTPAEWLSYYEDDAVKDKSKGLLPFRVWQIFKAMVEFVRDGDVTAYVTAAGVLAHYVGDACQPLHISFMFDGKPNVDGTKAGEHVHSIYETTMINKFIVPIMEKAKQLSDNQQFSNLVNIGNGKEAAGALVTLMKKTFNTIPPEDLVDVVIEFKDGQGLGDAAVAEELWNAFGEDTTGEIFVNGAYYLASLWQGAWIAGGGDQTIDTLDRVDTDAVSVLYIDKSFLPSVTLKKIDEHIDL